MDVQRDVFSKEKAAFMRHRQTILLMVPRNVDSELAVALDALNVLEYFRKIASEEEASRLLRQLCYLVPHSNESVVGKLCRLFINLLSRQKIVIIHEVPTLVEYLVEGLQTCSAAVTAPLLHALSTVVYENSGRLASYHDVLVGDGGILDKLCTERDAAIRRGIVQCLETLTIRTPNFPYLSESAQTCCFKLLLRILQQSRPDEIDEVNHYRILVNSLCALHNIVGESSVTSEFLGPVLAVIQVYMLHGLAGVPTVVPTCLHPTPLNLYCVRPATNDAPTTPNTPSRPAASSTVSRAGRRKKEETRGQQGCPTDNGMGGDGQINADTSSYWSQVSSSESDYSDTEGVGGGQGVVRLSLLRQVRQLVLNCFHNLIKVTEKKVMFGYWSSFLPSIGPQTHTLFATILKDPSPKVIFDFTADRDGVRTGALAVLTLLIEGSQPFLMVAEDSEQYQNAPFTTFSVMLGHMIKEVHRCLLLSLISENSPLAITQIIKCLGTLVPVVPYHRLRPGLLTKLVKQIKPFLRHKDANIRVGVLTCLGAVVSIRSPLPEVDALLTTSQHQRVTSRTSSSGDVLPVTTSGRDVPALDSEAQDINWVMWLCVDNVMRGILDGTGTGDGGMVPVVQYPLPERLESLQLLARLAKSRFHIVRDHLGLMQKLIQLCMEDSIEFALHLHALKLLEELGASLLELFQCEDSDKPELKTIVTFWLAMLDGPLTTSVQNETYSAVRATTCDCLANVGQYAFDALTEGKQILCLTMLLGLSKDNNAQVKAAAVRAIGVYSCYSTLRRDASWISDAANIIMNAISEKHAIVKVKAYWSLGNLTDALAENRSEGDAEFMEELPDRLLHQIIQQAIKGCEGPDKVKHNAVRSLGNLMRCLPQSSLCNFTETIKLAFAMLIKCISSGTMKVRWNACYTASKLLMNDQLLIQQAELSNSLQSQLASVLRECTNLKVKINAAMALSVPGTRALYGSSADHYAGAIRSLAMALDTAEDITDFGEYRYKENLLRQVCSTLVHLLGLLEPSDLAACRQHVGSNMDSLRVYFNKYIQLIDTRQSGHTEMTDGRAKTREKMVLLEKSHDHLEHLAELDMAADDMRTLRSLQGLLTPSDPDAENARTTSPRTAFSQTYD